MVITKILFVKISTSRNWSWTTAGHDDDWRDRKLTQVNMSLTLCSLHLCCIQPTVLLSHTNQHQPPAVFFLPKNQHQAPTLASRTQCKWNGTSGSTTTCVLTCLGTSCTLDRTHGSSTTVLPRSTRCAWGTTGRAESTRRA